ncbi:hypothetical protein P3X46_010145 [Hevea brasiliensis]|uniref:Tify domain-containing protein n=1 Tax=Hevea brasiliensis TaxID=3981 RepID=A0ABQ9MF73_HEVBR|nr:hypothetical protein P3X46_010145 [Hevea brasiliensis]
MANVAERDSSFDNPSRIEPKRSHQWFVHAAEPELFSNKKQALLTHNSTSSSQISSANISSWDNSTGFQSVPNQFIHRLFAPETARSVNFSERTLCPGTDDLNALVSLSISHNLEDAEAVNQVKGSDNGMHDPKGHSFINESNSDISTGHTFNREDESSFIPMGQAYDKKNGNIPLMGHSYNGDAHIVSTCNAYIKGDDNIPISGTYSKEDANMISFGGFHDAHDIIRVCTTINSYDQTYNKSSAQTPEAVHEKELDASNANAVPGNSQVAKSKPESVSRNKQEVKTTRKEAPNSFPSNVRSFISTGMLDVVPVKYVSLSREELHGIIKGSGYLCSCQSCNYSKVLNAYEFERHAGCKTKHPNNHICFENGKTIYQIVQELRGTPESLLFDVIQTVFGAPIYQKFFRIWKESFQAATLELQRIYGKEELNL